MVFVSHRTGSPELWTRAADGSGTKRISSWNGARLGTPRWSRDGQFIAFDGAQPGLARDIYLVRSGGGDVRRLTTSEATDIRPAWSRDSEWVYFCSYRTGGPAIWKAPVAGGEPIQVAGHAGFEFYEAADGSLYFHNKLDGTGEVERLPAKGGRPERVLANLNAKAWTAFDSAICFVKEVENGPDGLWFYDFSTRQSERFGELPDGLKITGSPGLSVSPDGKQILFSSFDVDPASDVMLVEGFR